MAHSELATAARSDPAGLARKIRAALGPCSLGTWPTPVAPADALGAEAGLRTLWLKREDRAAALYGGNKVRGLEFLLAGAPADAVFVTVGGTGSTHCLATAVCARRLGRRSALAQFPQPSTASADLVAARSAVCADVVARVRVRAALPLAVARAWLAARRLGAPRWIAGGGADPRAVIGHLLAALELGDQLRTPPDAIVLPLGTGSTAAGLVLGLACLGWPTRVVGVRVSPLLIANAWRSAWLARGARGLLWEHGVPVPRPASLLPLVVDGLGRGYGFPTDRGEAARTRAARHGLALDSTYGAKALAALADLPARGFRHVVFWHTFSFPPSASELTR